MYTHMTRAFWFIVLIAAGLWLSGCPKPPPPPVDDGSAVDATSPWAPVTGNQSFPSGLNGTNGGYVTRRLAVPNGWIYLTIVHCGHGMDSSQVFVYDPLRDRLARPLAGPENERK